MMRLRRNNRDLGGCFTGKEKMRRNGTHLDQTFFVPSYQFITLSMRNYIENIRCLRHSFYTKPTFISNVDNADFCLEINKRICANVDQFISWIITRNINRCTEQANANLFNLFCILLLKWLVVNLGNFPTLLPMKYYGSVCNFIYFFLILQGIVHIHYFDGMSSRSTCLICLVYRYLEKNEGNSKCTSKS